MKQIHLALAALIALTLCAAPAHAQYDRNQMLQDLRAFVMADYPLSVPCSQAREFGSEAVEELVSMLNDAEYEPYWENVVVTLGCIGDPAAVAPLQEFVANHKGKISFETFAALQGVPTALGFISQSGNAEALKTLAQLADESYWKDADVKILGDVVDQTVVRNSLTRSAVVALGYTGGAEADGILEMKDVPQEADWQVESDASSESPSEEMSDEAVTP